MRFLLGALVVLFNLTDNATTYLCLREPVPGFEIVEVNPIARWLFETLGLLEGLVFEMGMTTLAVGFLVVTRSVPPKLRLALLVVLTVLPAWASANNYFVLKAVGIPIALG
ncbi:MAG: hypothetical protein GY725_13545 [bacterium]|nr:hypothetical protein [bacterium]